MRVSYFLLLIHICFCGRTLVAQTNRVDSLLTLLKNEKAACPQPCLADSNKVIRLNAISLELSRVNPDSAILVANQSLAFAEKTGYRKGASLANGILANIYFYQGNYVESLKNNLAALRIRESLGDKRGMANSYNNIGNVYNLQDNFSEALKYHFAALNIRQMMKDTVNLAFSYNNIGNVYQKLGNYNEALKNHRASLKIKTETNDQEGVATSSANIGTVYIDLGNYDEAFRYLFSALKINQDIDSKEGIEITYVNLSYAYSKLKDYKTAEEYGLKALSLAEEIGDVETIIEANLQLSKIYQETGKFEKSLSHFTAYINLRDSLFNEKTIKNTVQTQLQYEFDTQNAITKLEQEKKDELSAKELKQKELERNYFIGGFALVILWSLFIIRGYRQKQKANKIIIQQKLEVEKQKSTIEEKNKDITSSITYAKRIQDAIFPPIESIKEKFPDSFVLYKSKDILGGDFYWVSDAVTKYEEEFFMAAVADCTGHGVPGALMSIIGNNYLRLCEREPTVNRPSEALDFINAGISRTLRQEYSKSSIQDGMDMAFVAIDYKTLQLHFAGANNPIYIVRGGTLTEYKGDSHPVGAFVGEEMKKFTNHTIPIQKGDCVYLFSDGYADQFGGPKGKKFMYNQFKNLLAANSHFPMEQQHEILVRAFDEWKGNKEQVDDVCVFGIRV